MNNFMFSNRALQLTNWQKYLLQSALIVTNGIIAGHMIAEHVDPSRCKENCLEKDQYSVVRNMVAVATGVQRIIQSVRFAPEFIPTDKKFLRGACLFFDVLTGAVVGVVGGAQAASAFAVYALAKNVVQMGCFKE